MQLRQLHHLEGAQGAYRFLTATPPVPPLASMPASFTQQVQSLGDLISQAETQASDQLSSRASLKDKVSMTNAAAKELRSGLLVPLKKVAKILAQGSTGAALSPDFAQAFTIPQSTNVQGLLAAARGAVANATSYMDLFVARGLPANFLDQITAQINLLVQATQAIHDTKIAKTDATSSLSQRLGEIRDTVHVLDINVQRACKADRTNGPSTKKAWETIKSIRKAAAQTDIPFAPATGQLQLQGVAKAA